MAGIQSCLSILAAGLIFTYLVQVFRASSNGLLAALKSERLLSDLHRGGPAALAAHPVSTRAVAESIPATCGVLLQFPFDEMIVGDYRYRA